jgi:CubicO group peptidase (beta-lactamase class C family)
MNRRSSISWKYLGGLLLIVVLAPAFARANTTLTVTKGSGEFRSQVTAISVSSPEALQFVWSTDQAGAVGGKWQVMQVVGKNQWPVVAQGQVTPVPAKGKSAFFIIPANAFLQTVPPPAPGVEYRVTITPYDAQNKPLDAGSPSVLVTQSQETAGPPIKFGPSAIFPDLELVHYQEQIGVVQSTQLQFALATVEVRAINRGKTATDPLWVSVTDAHLLMRQQSPSASVASLKPGASVVVTVKLQAILPPGTSQLPEDKQYNEWHQKYRSLRGVDLRGVMDWRGPQASTPIGEHQQVYLYEGIGDSTTCQEGAPDPRNAPPDKPVCNGGMCVSLASVLQHIHHRLDCRVVGYSLFVGPSAHPQSHGHARTSADAPPVNFTTSTKIPVASVSKVVTTLAAVRVLAKHGISLGWTIGPYLPKDWIVDPNVQNISFQQLLSHTSGIKDYGNDGQDYAGLKKLFTRHINANATTACNAPNPPDPITFDTQPCYSNYNFAIFRILLPTIEGFADTDPVLGPQRFADRYVQIAQTNVFNPVGVTNMDCKPPLLSKTYAFSYGFSGNQPGHDWGDNTLICGAAGWYLSVDDISKVLLSLDEKDGKVLDDAHFNSMEDNSLGWDQLQLPDGSRYLEKNGGWSWGVNNNNTSISTSIVIFGPRSGTAIVAILFLNSDITREPGVGADTVLSQTLTQAVKP